MGERGGRGIGVQGGHGEKPIFFEYQLNSFVRAVDRPVEDALDAHVAGGTSARRKSCRID